MDIYCVFDIDSPLGDEKKLLAVFSSEEKADEFSNDLHTTLGMRGDDRMSHLQTKVFKLDEIPSWLVKILINND